MASGSSLEGLVRKQHQPRGQGKQEPEGEAASGFSWEVVDPREAASSSGQAPVAFRHSRMIWPPIQWAVPMCVCVAMSKTPSVGQPQAGRERVSLKLGCINRSGEV